MTVTPIAGVVVEHPAAAVAMGANVSWLAVNAAAIARDPVNAMVCRANVDDPMARKIGLEAFATNAGTKAIAAVNGLGAILISIQFRTDVIGGVDPLLRDCYRLARRT